MCEEYEDDDFNEPTLTPEQLKWLKHLERHLKKMPEGIELILGYGHLDTLPAGWYKREIWDAGTDMLLEGGAKIGRDSLMQIKIDSTRIRPNSESV